MGNDLSKRAIACKQRAIACKHWRWMPGMLSLPPQADRCQRDGQMMVERLPDLTDPATLGCLLALVREAWGWDSAFTCHDESGWCVNSGADCDVDLQDEAGDAERYATEAAALVAALEAAEGWEVSDGSHLPR